MARGSGRRQAVPGSKDAVVGAARAMRDEGAVWSRRVLVAQRKQQRLVKARESAGEERSGITAGDVADAARAVREARDDDAQLRAALADLERQLAECTETEADWALQARLDADRVAAGLAGEPDPAGGAPGTIDSLRGLPPAVMVAGAVWVLAVVALLAVALAGRV
ncbi:MAG: hypothetical protein RIB67_08290 [Miltoncostaeaceae bacterium]